MDIDFTSKHLPNRNDLRPDPAPGRAPYEGESGTPGGTSAATAMAASMVVCSLGAFAINHWALRLVPDKWSAAIGMMVPFFAGDEWNFWLADVPQILIHRFTWSDYDVSQRYSSNPRRAGEL